MSKKRLWGEVMKYSIRISLFAVLLLATTISLALAVGKPWWETRLPSPDDCKVPRDFQSTTPLLSQTPEGECVNWGGQVSPNGIWCIGGKYNKCRIEPFKPLKPEQPRYLNKKDTEKQKQKIKGSAGRVKKYSGSLK